MTQPLHSWAYNPKDTNTSTKTLVYPCLLLSYVQETGNGISLDVHKNKQIMKYNTQTQWDFIEA